MRLHTLELEAFGPFPGHESVDFDALSEAGLFLLQGPTGSGKTSLLDALCFGLFGQLPGARRGREAGIRSDHAAPSRAPWVQVTFSVRGRRLRVRRSPEWQRPKQRGSGTTKAQASATLEEHDGASWVPLATRIPDVASAVSHALGMGLEQFTRVALLPQGEFATFLRAKVNEREELLRSLFDTGLFDRTQQEAREHRQRLEARVGEALTQRDAVVQRLAETVAAALPDEPADVGALDVDPEDGTAASDEESAEADAAAAVGEPEWFQGLLARARTAEDAAAGAHAAADAELERVTAAHGALERRRQDAAALRALRAREAALAEGAERSAQQRSRRDAHHRAVGVRSELDALQAAAHRRQAATEEEEQARDALRAVDADVPARAGEDPKAWAALVGEGAEAASVPTLESWLERAEKAVEAATDAVRAEEAAAAAQGEKQRADEESSRAHSALAQAQDQAKEATGAAEEARARLAEHAPPEESDEELARAEESARQGLVTAREAESARQELAELEERENAAEAERRRTRDAAHRLARLRLEHLVASLAQDLTPGEPCAVCGSQSHPQPAVAPELGPSEAGDLSDAAQEKADAERAAAEARYEEHAAETAACRERRASLVRASGGMLPEEAERTLEQASRRRLEAQAQRAEHEELERAVTDAEHAETRANDRLTDRSQRAESAKARFTTAEANLEEARQRLAASLAGYGSASQRRSATQAWAAALRRCLQAARTAGIALDELTRARTGADEALAAAGFDSADAARGAVLPPAEAAAVERDVKERAAEEARVAEIAGSEAIMRAVAALDAGEAEPSEEGVAAAADAVRHARTERDATLRALSLAQDLSSRIEAEEAEVARRDAELGPLRRDMETAARLDGLLSGNGSENLKKMSLSTYVLAARLEAVAEAATERLLTMSQGRFRLVHTAEKSGRGRSGLGLAVEDGWTGVTRSPESLSGGETFMASLSLALGLADVVQEESGGVDVETLFVDEGFGTLDSQALNDVMEAIDSLREGGRLVGLISHVPEMAQRIPAQVRITKTLTGSSAQTVGTGPGTQDDRVD